MSRPDVRAPGAGPFSALREQLLDAAAAFTGGPVPEILAGMVDDVDRALREKLEIFPVCHHSPASALAMVRRLREKQPKVVYMELCEDLRPVLDEVPGCTLPVALQAFANVTDGFPAEWAPLSVVAPLTEASAEYQAIAYALEAPDVELVLVDRSCDHVFQWAPPERTAGDDGPGKDDAPDGPAHDAAHDDEGALHGDSVGLEIGDLRPQLAELEEHLVRHGKVRHWSEWWDQYVEQPLTGADYDTYRQVMVMIGSLFRRLRRDADDRDEDRERYMWTRMREHLAATSTDPSDCLYVCGAFHAASRVEQFGLSSTPESSAAESSAAESSTAPEYEITPRSATHWQYGLIPSSHSAIEAQFGLASGSVSIAAATWAKAVKRSRAKPFTLSGDKRGRGASATPAPATPAPATPAPATPAAATPAAATPAPLPQVPVSAEQVTDHLSDFLSKAPALDTLDEEELLGWSVDVVRLARRHGYLASTADAIAVFETSILLAGMRGRARPTPYDFQDAAITCIEKDTVPGRRDVRRLCEILLGGDRIGRVGYEALPPLARDALDRLEPLGLDLQRRTAQRALLDLRASPELEPCSHLLWMLRRLLPDEAVRPIMGSRRLGERSVQESWDLAIGRHQRALVELGYEGVTVEQVLEKRLRRAAWDPDATASTALQAVEDAIVYLGRPDGHARLADDLGARAVELLAAERTVDDAPDVLRRIRRLLGHYRATGGLPAWCQAFVSEGYAHYCTLLPTAFVDEDAGVRQVGAMLGFLFSMESLALSLGCDRSQLELAVRQSHPEDPAKTALLWAARFQLGSLPLAALRSRCAELLANPLVVPSFPRYLSGFVHALEPAPALTPFVVEVMSHAFGSLPDAALLPFLPDLITTLRTHAAELAPVLIREAGRTFPGTLTGVDTWTPPWNPTPADAPTTPAGPASVGGPATDLLATHPATCDAIAQLLGHDTTWRTAPEPHHQKTATLLTRHPQTANAVATLLG